MSTMIEGFFGVFAPDGELEAVENSEAGARISAINLSPHKDGKPPAEPNRTIRPVIILTHDPLTAIGPILRRMAALAAAASSKADAKLAAMKLEAAQTKSHLPDNHWHDAHEHRVRAARLAIFADAIEGQ